MAVEGDMRAALAADATVAATVVARIYPGVAPQDADFPKISYRMSEGGPLQTSGGPSSTKNPTYAFESRALTYAGAKALGAAVANVLDGWSNKTGTPSVGSCRLTDESEDEEYRSDDSEELVYVILQEYSVWYA